MNESPPDRYAKRRATRQRGAAKKRAKRMAKQLHEIEQRQKASANEDERRLDELARLVSEGHDRPASDVERAELEELIESNGPRYPGHVGEPGKYLRGGSPGPY